MYVANFFKNLIFNMIFDSTYKYEETASNKLN